MPANLYIIIIIIIIKCFEMIVNLFHEKVTDYVACFLLEIIKNIVRAYMCNLILMSMLSPWVLLHQVKAVSSVFSISGSVFYLFVVKYVSSSVSVCCFHSCAGDEWQRSGTVFENQQNEY